MATVGELGNEPIKGNQHAGQYLNFLWIARRFETFHCFNLVAVDLYSSVSDQIPQELASPHFESTLLGIESYFVPSKYFKHFFEVANMLYFLLALYHHIIDVDLDNAPNFISEHSSHHPLICGTSILQPKWHHSVMVVSVGRDKRLLLLVLDSQGDLMIILKSVKKAHPRVPICGIYQLINFWHKKRVL